MLLNLMTELLTAYDACKNLKQPRILYTCSRGQIVYIFADRRLLLHSNLSQNLWLTCFVYYCPRIITICTKIHARVPPISVGADASLGAIFSPWPMYRTSKASYCKLKGEYVICRNRWTMIQKVPLRITWLISEHRAILHLQWLVLHSKLLQECCFVQMSGIFLSATFTLIRHYNARNKHLFPQLWKSIGLGLS